MTTGITKNEDGSYSLLAIFAVDDDNNPLTGTIPTGTSEADCAVQAQTFFAKDVAAALNGPSGYPLDCATALFSDTWPDFGS